MLSVNDKGTHIILMLYDGFKLRERKIKIISNSPS